MVLLTRPARRRLRRLCESPEKDPEEDVIEDSQEGPFWAPVPLGRTTTAYTPPLSLVSPAQNSTRKRPGSGFLLDSSDDEGDPQRQQNEASLDGVAQLLFRQPPLSNKQGPGPGRQERDDPVVEVEDVEDPVIMMEDEDIIVDDEGFAGHPVEDTGYNSLRGYHQDSDIEIEQGLSMRGSHRGKSRERQDPGPRGTASSPALIDIDNRVQQPQHAQEEMEVLVPRGGRKHRSLSLTLQAPVCDLTSSPPSPVPTRPVNPFALRFKSSRPQPIEHPEPSTRSTNPRPMQPWQLPLGSKQTSGHLPVPSTSYPLPVHPPVIQGQPPNLQTTSNRPHSTNIGGPCDDVSCPAPRTPGPLPTSTAAPHVDPRDAEAGLESEPWWMILPDFTPVQVLASGLDPRTGAEVYVDYISQFSRTESTQTPQRAKSKKKEHPVYGAVGNDPHPGQAGNPSRRRAKAAAQDQAGAGRPMGYWTTEGSGAKVFVTHDGEKCYGQEAWRAYQQEKGGGPRKGVKVGKTKGRGFKKQRGGGRKGRSRR